MFIEYDSFHELHGIVHEFSAPYTPQHNSLVKRKNHNLVDMINSILLNAKLLYNVWGKALLMGCHIMYDTIKK